MAVRATIGLGAQRFGKYFLVDKIGEGGMAEVFRALSLGPEGFQRQFVVKRIIPSMTEDEHFVQMFIDEAKISALLSHPNIVQVYEFGQIAGSYFIAMEHVHGQNLAALTLKLAQTGRLAPPPIAAEIVRQACLGLEHAHAMVGPEGRPLGIVHRDVTPSNIMLAFNGAVKILDFGIARARNEARGGRTQAGVVKGKIAYLAPEQLQEGFEIDARVDVFSMGVVFWEQLTGKRLFKADNELAAIRMVMESPVPPPSSKNPEVSPALDRIAMRALERDREQRYQSAGDMAGELEEYLIEERYSSQLLPKFLRDIFRDEISKSNELALPAHVTAAAAAAAAEAAPANPAGDSVKDLQALLVEEPPDPADFDAQATIAQDDFEAHDTDGNIPAAVKDFDDKVPTATTAASPGRVLPESGAPVAASGEFVVSETPPPEPGPKVTARRLPPAQASPSWPPPAAQAAPRQSAAPAPQPQKTTLPRVGAPQLPGARSQPTGSVPPPRASTVGPGPIRVPTGATPGPSPGPFDSFASAPTAARPRPENHPPIAIAPTMFPEETPQPQQLPTPVVTFGPTAVRSPGLPRAEPTAEVGLPPPLGAPSPRSMPPPSARRSAYRQPAPFPRANPKVVYGLAAGGAFLGVLAMMWFFSRRGDETARPQARSPHAAPPMIEPVPPPVSSRPAPPTVEPLRADTVKVSLDSVPQGARVFVRSSKIEQGVTPLQLELPRGTLAVELTLKKDGFKATPFKVIPDLDKPALVSLEPESARRFSRPSSDDEWSSSRPSGASRPGRGARGTRTMDPAAPPGQPGPPAGKKPVDIRSGGTVDPFQ